MSLVGPPPKVPGRNCCIACNPLAPVRSAGMLNAGVALYGSRDHSGMRDKGFVMPEIVSAHDCDGNHPVVIRAILSAVSPFWNSLWPAHSSWPWESACLEQLWLPEEVRPLHRKLP